MQNNNSQIVKIYATKVSQIVNKCHYNKVVLQLPKNMLTLAFELTSFLQKQCKDTQFYILYDSLKQSCCTDVLGAEHVSYDGLVHFGKACFSEQHQSNHHYIFQQPESGQSHILVEALNSKEVQSLIDKNQVRYILADQRYYQLLKEKVFTNFRINGSSAQLLRLPYDKQSEDQYIVFGYYGSREGQGKNILVISEEQTGEEMSVAEQLMFALKGIANKVGQQLFIFNFRSQNIQPLSLNQNKLLMQRYSLISQLDNYKIFGLIVSNTSTQFHARTLNICKKVLQKHGKKYFTFMMNNLNQVKLGNFPEIEVYVIISCYNHSLFGLKQFHRLVVTPNDLMVAFEGRQFDQYIFDCRVDNSAVKIEEEHKEEKEGNIEKGMQLDKMGNSQLMLQQKIQTLQYYRQRDYKGLQFTEKKEVKKMTKGKVGLAQSYKPLE